MFITKKGIKSVFGVSDNGKKKVIKTSEGKNITKFRNNPISGGAVLKVKDVTYKTESTPSVKFKEKLITTPSGKRYEKRKLKEGGKVVKREKIRVDKNK